MASQCTDTECLPCTISRTWTNILRHIASFLIFLIIIVLVIGATAGTIRLTAWGIVTATGMGITPAVFTALLLWVTVPFSIIGALTTIHRVRHNRTKSHQAQQSGADTPNSHNAQT